MLPTDHLLAFLLVAAVLIAVPGPSVLFTITRSLTLGRRAGIATVAGNAAGVYVQVIAVAVGVGTLVQESIAVFTIVKLAGAAYLVSLGVQAVRDRRSLAAALGAPVQPKVLRRILGDAFLVGILNPKVIVFFMIALVFDSVWALAAGVTRDWLVRSPRRLEAIGAGGGVVMIGLGAGLAISGRPTQ